MAPISSAKQLVDVAVVTFLLATASGRQQPVHLRLNMHDVMRGLETTAIHLIHSVGPPHDIERGSYFGDTAAIDDVVVTEEPNCQSKTKRVGPTGHTPGEVLLHPKN